MSYRVVRLPLAAPVGRPFLVGLRLDRRVAGSATVTLTPSPGLRVSPPSVVLDADGHRAATFACTALAHGPMRVDFANDAGLADPPAARFHAVSPDGVPTLPPDPLAALRDAVVAEPRPYPGDVGPRGVVVCGGGPMLPDLYLTLRDLRRVGCRLPVEVWHLGPAEVPDAARRLLDGVGGVTLVDAERVEPVVTAPLVLPYNNAADRARGFRLKPVALARTRFREALLLDADNSPLRDPTFLFDRPEFAEHGAMFWPDAAGASAGWNAGLPTLWADLGLDPRGITPEFESGQMVVDRLGRWHEVALVEHMALRAEYFYRRMWGDKDSFQLAWRLRDTPRWLGTPVRRERAGFVQLGPDGRPLFWHRTGGAKVGCWQDRPSVAEVPVDRGASLREVQDALDRLTDAGLWRARERTRRPAAAVPAAAVTDRPAARPRGDRPVIVCTLYRRPGYARRVVEALERCAGVDRYLVLFHCEPDVPAVVDVARRARLDKRVVVNPARLGCMFNTYAALCDGFAHDDYVIALEDDTVLAPDALRFFEHCRGRHADDPTVWSVSGYARNAPADCAPGDELRYGRRPHFTCWGWATWADRFREALAAEWRFDEPTRPWARFVQAARGDRVEVAPIVSRVQNVGAEAGTYSKGPAWHAAHHFNPDGAWNWPGGVAADGAFEEVDGPPARLAVRW